MCISGSVGEDGAKKVNMKHIRFGSSQCSLFGNGYLRRLILDTALYPKVAHVFTYQYAHAVRTKDFPVMLRPSSFRARNGDMALSLLRYRKQETREG
jgi:hypothetical protein